MLVVFRLRMAARETGVFFGGLAREAFGSASRAFSHLRRGSRQGFVRVINRVLVLCGLFLCAGGF